MITSSGITPRLTQKAITSIEVKASKFGRDSQNMTEGPKLSNTACNHSFKFPISINDWKKLYASLQLMCNLERSCLIAFVIVLFVDENSNAFNSETLAKTMKINAIE